MDQTQEDYGLHLELDLPYEEAVDAVTSALQVEGFGVLTEIDVKATMKKKLDADFRKYVILGACNPPLAHRALTAEPAIGLMLPCNVIVYETGDESSHVSLIDPLVMINIAGNPQLEAVAQEAYERLQRVRSALQPSLS